MSLSRILNEFRPLVRMLDEPLFRAPGYYNPGFRGRSALLEDPFFQNLNTRPAVDVSEDANKYIVEAEVPGVKKDALEIRVGDGGQSLTIEGRFGSRQGGEQPAAADNAPAAATEGTSDSTAVTKAADAPNQISTERTVFGNFTRTVWLPRPVDASKVSAKLNDGILTVTVPKAEDKGSTVIPVE
ncbi:HSP20-like chaperone [Schizophyllum commune H4-8]|uniref:HSP20-like chaperone n=1 Tax=Schizophyllum commune (strain H4-8 / FGSC 9210) TaxID=578458 RepID=UPI00215E1896|nr:HSP20-like chaperone [Schizophyllum commune H4-8]KAI5896517.1 HSP20-like chaperone [Schizophyllum commune H4-8]